MVATVARRQRIKANTHNDSAAALLHGRCCIAPRNVISVHHAARHECEHQAGSCRPKRALRPPDQLSLSGTQGPSPRLQERTARHVHAQQHSANDLRTLAPRPWQQARPTTRTRKHHEAKRLGLMMHTHNRKYTRMSQDKEQRNIAHQRSFVQQITM